MRSIKKNQDGFTIVELMIATLILSILLLLATAVFTKVGDDYVKGIYMANTQRTARNILDQISQNLQFGADDYFTNTYPLGGSSPTLRSVCIGTTRYSYVVNAEQGSDTAHGQSNHVLWQDTMPAGSSSCTPLDVTQPTPQDVVTHVPVPAGKDLVNDKMRLTGLCISPLTNGVEPTINVWLAYGDDDLLGSTSGSDGCGGAHRYCNGGAGQQFCAVAELQTSVVRRVQ